MAQARRSTRPAGDVTGRNAERLAAEAEEQQEARTGLTTTGLHRGLTTVEEEGVLVDVTDAANPRKISITDDDVTEDERYEVERTRALGGDVVDVGAVEVSERTRLMRVSEKISPTIGFGNDYSFEPGKVYRVPEVVYLHLDDIGYVYH